MSPQFVLLEQQGPLWVLSLNRPEALNALNTQLMKEFEALIIQCREAFPTEIRGLIITGAGPKSFVAGADIAEMKDLEEAEAREFSFQGQKIMNLIEDLPFPVMAVVNGFALGGGLELAMACDFRWASQKAKLGLPEVGLGLIPGFGGTSRLPSHVGFGKALEMMLSAEMVTADEALQIGLVNRVFPHEELLAQAKAWMNKLIASTAPLAVAEAKKLARRDWLNTRSENMKSEAQAFGRLFDLMDTKEGTKAFIEKRKPHYVGR